MAKKNNASSAYWVHTKKQVSPDFFKPIKRWVRHLKSYESNTWYLETWVNVDYWLTDNTEMIDKWKHTYVRT